jgi:TPR repeat protein
MHGLQRSITQVPARASLLRWLSGRALASSLAVSTLLALSPAAGAQGDLWERAAAEYEVQHFARALSLYEELARGGSAQAAELAGTMLLCGEALYGNEVQRDRTRAAGLLKVAAEDGRPVAALLLKRISAVQVAVPTGEAPVDSWSEPKPFESALRAD